MITNEPHAQMIDVGAITIWIAAMANVLPAVAAFLSVIWMLIRIAETNLVQKMLGKYAWIKPHDTTKD